MSGATAGGPVARIASSRMTSATVRAIGPLVSSVHDRESGPALE